MIFINLVIEPKAHIMDAKFMMLFTTVKHELNHAGVKHVY